MEGLFKSKFRVFLSLIKAQTKEYNPSIEIIAIGKLQGLMLAK